MQSEELSLGLAIGALVLLVAFVALLVFRTKIGVVAYLKNSPKAARIARVVYILACIPITFLMIEIPYNRDIFSMEMLFVLLDFFIIAATMLTIYFAAQQSRISLGIFLIICFAAGIANGFVVQFKGQPVLASDLLAITTAAEVASGYTYNITNEMLTSSILLEAMLCLLTLLPKIPVTKLTIFPNVAIAALCMTTLFLWYTTTDISEEYDCTVDAWSSRESYEKQSAILCIIERTQEFTPQPPDWYTPEEAEQRFAMTADAYLASETEREGDRVLPSIVAIMNETFADLSDYTSIDPTYAGPWRFKKACEDALLSGNVYVSALGGGTCNSEFEFLLGSSDGLLGPGIYPYMLYDFKNVDNIVSYLSDAGYDTTAIHPAEGSNWRRNIVYDQLGFDTFYDIESMRDAETIRGLVTDAETYEITLDILESSEDPQFIFDVTIANHGGYTTDEIPANERVYVTDNGEADAEIEEYVSLIERSDREFADFLNKIEQLDEPVVVCMFGDHQPGFVDRLAEESIHTTLDDMTLEQAQIRFMTPYLIWTNSDEIRQSYGTGHHEDMSLNYLSANLIEAAELPLDRHFAYLLGIQEQIPVINLNGYVDAEGTWRWHNEDSVSSDAYWELKIVQYNQLFDD